jgi:uncharacterized protein
MVELGLRGHAFLRSDGTYDFATADRSGLLRAVNARHDGQDRAAIRRYLARRARDLGFPEAIPAGWRQKPTTPIPGTPLDQAFNSAGLPQPHPGQYGHLRVVHDLTRELLGDYVPPKVLPQFDSARAAKVDPGTSCDCQCTACRCCEHRVDSDDDDDDPKGDDANEGVTSAGQTGYVSPGDATCSRAVRELRLTDAPGGLCRVQGVVAPFGTPTIIYDRSGPYTESIAAGAFDSVLAGDTVLLTNHDSSTAAGIPLARTTAGTLKLSTDARGLLFSATLDPDSPAVQSILSAVRRGDLCGCSFSFTVASPGGDVWSDGMSKRVITRVNKLFDCALVTYPAYAVGTSVQLARQRSREIERARAMERLRQIRTRRTA